MKIGSNQNDLEVFEDFTKDESWMEQIKETITSKLAIKSDKKVSELSSQKNEEDMTKLLCQVMNDFDADYL